MPQPKKQGSPDVASSPPTGARSPGAATEQSAQRNGSSEGRKISSEDIQLVQNLIERCLLLYMNRKEVVHTLHAQAKVEPGFTSLVWMKLEEQNPDFFKAYYTRLKLKLHIATFNHLLDQQAELRRKLGLLPQVYPSQVSQMIPTQPSHLRHPASQNLEHSTHRDSSAMELATAPGELNSTADVLFSFGTSAELPGMGLDSSFVHQEPQPMESLQSDGDGMSTRDSLSSLSQLPRNFSLSDLTADLGPNSRFPRNFSLSDLTADLGADFGALGNYTSPFVSDEAYLHSPKSGGFDEEPMLEFGD
ncbi:uncharacterized protein LOC112344162 [Selaginella moellendorffii]|uniref:uncharacterized protein LOC112344162 n=1 Tax=Selaginella moellendorffii TaxID=88036 RepID=UPI000D1CBA66|nr:uncharacterized protein LOC112344162 [Selaginella moellendorffii]|eukprot:XP_024524210.1 uncharacterized protein LOC112344162 [Selaginella moellendorffii]